MPNSPRKSIWLDLQINPDDPQLLATLEQMLQSGMLDTKQINKIARDCLSERLPVTPYVPEVNTYTEPKPISAEPSFPVAPEPVVPTIWQTLKDELSVRWLLFLGVFLVVLSSGVLAATQWSRFPAWGQYGLLWLYTIGFWLTGSWAKRQEGLRLTANTLQIAALLLIPVNFWAIDSFGLWHQPWEIATAVVAASSLAGIAYLQTLPRRNKSRSHQWLMGAFIGLSCLQLGWQIPHWAAISIYIGSIGVAIILQKTRQVEKGALAIFGLGMLILRGFFVVHLPVTSFSLAIGIVGWLFAQWGIQYQKKLQRVESIALKHPSPQIHKHQKTLSELITLYHRLGAGLLALGWSIGLNELFTSPWQSVAISALALIWIWQRLQRDHHESDLVWLFVVGLQAYFLSSFLWRFLSTGALLAMVLPWIKQFFGENYLFAGGLLVFPYLLLWVWLTAWFWRKGEESLARTGEGLMMGTGLLMTVSTGANPLGLLIDLVVSTAILVHLTHRRPPIRSSYVYLTHLGGLLTVFAAVNYRWDWCRSIGQRFIVVTDAFASRETLIVLVVFSLVSMVLAAIELLFSTRKVNPEKDVWQHSSWDYGQILAGLSYAGCLLIMASTQFIWPLWLMIVPTAFTYVAIHSHQKSTNPVWQQNAQKQSIWWAIGSMVGSILLIGNDTNWRSIILATSIAMICPIMWKMAQEPLDPAASEQLAEDKGFQHLRLIITRQAVAVGLIHIGLVLGLGANLLQGRIADPQWLVVAALVSTGLWLISKRLQRQNISPPAIYAKAGDAWASIVAAMIILTGMVHYFYTNLQFQNGAIGSLALQKIGSPRWFDSLDLSLLLATTILLWAIANRQRWHSAWTPAIWFTTALITGQIILGSGIQLLGGSTWTLAIGNVFLAFCLYCWQTYGQPRFINTSAASLMPVLNNTALPSLLAAWGLVLRLSFFNNYSGLLSIGIGAILILNSRSYSFKLPAYAGLSLISIGCYELVTYQLLQAPPGGNIADALTIYGLVTAILALIYRSIVWLKSRKGATDFWDLSLDSLKNVAHAHWAIASTWKIAAAVTPPIPLPHFTILHLITSGLLGVYALIQGRDKEDNGDWWVYLGLAELMGVGVYARSIFQGLGIVDSNLILVTCLIGLMLMLAPWANWGWRDRPWRIVAIALPLSRVIFEWEYISLLNLAILATFYAGVARRQRQFAWAYLSLVFVNWAGMRLLWQYSLTSPIWYGVMVGLSILAVVQWDPAWQKSRQNRHYGRLAGAGVITVTALIWHVAPQPWVPISLGLAIGAAGLVWRVRAWFYVGTITFLLSNFYQLVIVITERPVTKWAIGLFAGMLIIFLAANFEKRREQITKALQHWLDRLQEWQ
jgi:hypothetical protein